MVISLLDLFCYLNVYCFYTSSSSSAAAAATAFLCSSKGLFQLQGFKL
jgi:hypothetical protein